MVVGLFVNQKIKNTIEEELKDFTTYENLKVHSLGRTIWLENLKLNLKDVEVFAEKVTVDGFSLPGYLFEDRVKIKKVFLEQPEIIFSKAKTDTLTSETKKSFKQTISIGSFEIFNGNLKLTEDGSSEKLFLDLKTFMLENISIDEKSIAQKIPFRFESFEVVSDSIQLDLDPQHYLTVESSRIKNGEISSKSLKIIPKYDKVEFQRQISKEKDRYELDIEHINFDALSWGFEGDTLQLNNPVLTIDGANLQVYRNKLLPDDERIKPLYSATLRNLPVKVDFKEIQVKNSSIVYEEKIRKSTPPAKVSFYELHASITNVRNTRMKATDFPKTRINANALFMNETYLEVDWDFDIRNTRDEFQISGNFKSLSHTGINSFLVPAMQIEARGGIDYLAFNFGGNNDRAIGDMQLKYEDFKINILREGKKVNKFFSAIANFFMSNDAVNEDISRENLTITRNKIKSFWNFLWLCIREGAIDSLF